MLKEPTEAHQSEDEQFTDICHHFEGGSPEQTTPETNGETGVTSGNQDKTSEETSEMEQLI